MSKFGELLNDGKIERAESGAINSRSFMTIPSRRGDREPRLAGIKIRRAFLSSARCCALVSACIRLGGAARTQKFGLKY